MFTQTFVLACIASIASADQHTQNKIAMVNSLAQTRSNHSQTMGLTQVMAKAMVKTQDDSEHTIHPGQDESIPAPPGGMMLAQTAASEGHTCHSAQDRNKAALPDFFSIYNGTEMYTDPDFKADNDSLYWADMGEDLSSKASRITWTRASEAFSSYTLFGDDGVHPDDIEQGSLGNCWFLSAAATMAQIPGTVEKMFLNSDNEISPNGIYAVNFYALGTPLTVIVDDYLPLNNDGNTYFAGLGDNSSRGDRGSLWVPIIEKAFAKYHGNYQHIIGGNPAASARTMHNAPSNIQSHRSANGVTK